MLSIEPACDSLLREPVVVGLSGGRDSVALLRLLAEQGRRVYACHVHHGIRGEAAEEDAVFCAELCASLGVPCELFRVDIPALAAACGESLETVARRERRRLLAEYARRVHCRAIALAHHADDQAETVLFHLARGSAGLRGMQAVSEADGLLWLRPLLSCRRSEITAWLQQIHQNWRDDATNAVPDVTRNALRLHVLPALQQAMGRDVTLILTRSARLQSECASALQVALEALPLTDPQGRLFLPFLAGKPEAFRKAVVHFYLRREGVRELSEQTVLGVCSLLEPGAAASVYNLPGGLRARRAHKRLFIEAAGSEPCVPSA